MSRGRKRAANNSDPRDRFKLYRITCIPTGMLYIGITSGALRTRWNSHVTSAVRLPSTKMAIAINKYGRDSFVMEHVASCFTYTDLLAMEVVLIRQYNSKWNGLNSTIGGDGVIGLRHSDECRLRMSASRKLMWDNPDYRKKISVAQKLAWARKSPAEIEQRRIRARGLDIFRKRKPRPRKPKRVRPSIFRGLGSGGNMTIKTHCPYGHPYSGDNLMFGQRGGRVCRICKRRDRNKARDRRTRQALLNIIFNPSTPAKSAENSASPSKCSP